jgi:cytochrome b
MHGYAARGILFMALVHVIGVLVASVRHRENLALAMLSGHKRHPSPTDVA